MIGEAQHDALAAWLGEQLGDRCRIERADRISMGQSRAMFVVSLDCARGGPRKVVVRVEQWGLLGSDSRNEVQVMRAVRDIGFPVAEILGYEASDDVLGQPFFAMEFVPGTSVYRQESLDPYLDAIARLHAIEVDTLELPGLPVPKGPRDAALLQIERWYDVYRGALIGEPSPLVEEAAQWLRNHAPETPRVCLVHGDTGPGNYLHEDGALRAVVDWEFAHLGDPEEDWAYLICMRGMGIMTPDAWVSHLAERVGVTLEKERLDYWIAFNLFKGACIDQTALGIYMSRKLSAPNLLAIGTCVHLSALKRLADTVR